MNSCQLLVKWLEVDDEQQQLRADQRRDDHPDAQVEDLVAVEAGLPRARAAASHRPSR